MTAGPTAFAVAKWSAVTSMAFLALSAFSLVAIAEEQLRRTPVSAGEMQLSFAPLVEQTAPAVVNVYAKTVVRQRHVSPFFDDPFFRHFFGDRGFGVPRERVSNSLGSGVIVDPSGLVVTNYHVIRDASEVKIALADRREFEAEIVVKDERTDLAVLRITGADDPFPALEFEDSDALLVGDLVLAIGNPFGVGQTVTSGIVSALARNRVGVSDYQFFIQTDAAINPGNSGGALIDMNGRLVGINTAIYSRSGGSNGIGFAIPANMVKLVVQSHQSGGKVRRPWFGARLQDVTPDIAEGLGLDKPQGVLVAGVLARSPAERAGLGVGDVILDVDGISIGDLDGFGYRFTTQGVEGSVPMTVLRGGKRQTVDVALTTAPEDPPRDERLIDGASPIAGATVVNISPAVAEEFRIQEAAYLEAGVLVTAVDRRSPARSFGLRPGDIVLTINDRGVTSTRELDRITDRRRRLWTVSIRRGDRVLTSTVNG